MEVVSNLRLNLIERSKVFGVRIDAEATEAVVAGVWEAKGERVGPMAFSNSWMPT